MRVASRPPGTRQNAVRSIGGAVLPLVVLIGGIAPKPSDAAPPAAATTELPPAVPLSLETSDGYPLAVWHYPTEATSPVATVILLHDLGGSHETVEPLALALQQAGCAVVAPDLRGHGESIAPDLARASGSRSPSDLLKRNDFAAMVATGGGRVRDQASLQGDIETVRNWLKSHSSNGLDRLYLVGSGFGAALAAHWANADAAWPPLTSGPQGGDVKGLVLVEPTFVAKGFQILPALSREPLKTKLPVMVITGPNAKDADKVFEPLKRSRPDDWFDSRDQRGSPAKDSEATLVFAQLEGRDGRGRALSGDAFASLRADKPGPPDPAFLITAFIKATSGRRP